MVNNSKGPWLTFNVKSLTHGGLTDHLDFQIRWYIKQKSNNFWKQVMTFPLSISFVQNIFNTILFTYYKNLLTLVVKYKAPLSPKSTSQVAGQGEQGKDRTWGKSNTYFICCEVSLAHFLGPRGPLVLPLSVRPSVRPSRAKNLDPMYTGIYAS